MKSFFCSQLSKYKVAQKHLKKGVLAHLEENDNNIAKEAAHEFDILRKNLHCWLKQKDIIQKLSENRMVSSDNILCLFKLGIVVDCQLWAPNWANDFLIKV